MHNKEDKIADPVNHYKTPKDVDLDDELSVTEKVILLKNWLDDINLRLIAEAENMQNNKESRYHAAEVNRLLEKYQNLQSSN